MCRCVLIGRTPKKKTTTLSEHDIREGQSQKRGSSRSRNHKSTVSDTVASLG